MADNLDFSTTWVHCEKCGGLHEPYVDCGKSIGDEIEAEADRMVAKVMEAGWPYEKNLRIEALRAASRVQEGKAMRGTTKVGDSWVKETIGAADQFLRWLRDEE